MEFLQSLLPSVKSACDKIDMQRVATFEDQSGHCNRKVAPHRKPPDKEQKQETRILVFKAIKDITHNPTNKQDQSIQLAKQPGRSPTQIQS